MPVRAWEFAIATVFLVLCAIIGLYITDDVAPRPAIGLVRFEGEIDLAAADNLITLLEAARKDDRVAGVVLELMSPGGYATSSESIYYALLNLRAKKPVVVVVDSLAASGGYYMAAAGNRIFAPASAYIGNVGTRGGRPTDPTLATDELTSGPYKLEGGSRFDQIHQLDLVAQSFVQNVVSQRSASPVNPLKLTPEELGEARIYLGSEALALGLIDGEGSRSEGISAAAELAGLEDYEVVELRTLLGIPAPEPLIGQNQSTLSLLTNAPVGVILMLDSRIPLPALDTTPSQLPSKRNGDNFVAGRTHRGAWAEALPSPMQIAPQSGE